jgi:RNA polymerase sigma-70 factor (ECF subfamily)
MSETADSALGNKKSAAVSADQESAWVSASRRGDTLAFNRLVLKWERTVYNVALRMLQDRDEAAEATQEVFLLAFKNIRHFREKSRFSTWLYRIALNRCVTRARQKPPGVHLSLDDEDAQISSARQLRTSETQSHEVIRLENRKRVLTALSHLPPDQRAVVELKFFQDLTFEDISAVLETPLSTVKSRLYAGLEMLKIRLVAGA